LESSFVHCANEEKFSSLFNNAGCTWPSLYWLQSPFKAPPNNCFYLGDAQRFHFFLQNKEQKIKNKSVSWKSWIYHTLHLTRFSLYLYKLQPWLFQTRLGWDSSSFMHLGLFDLITACFGFSLSSCRSQNWIL